MGLKKRKRAFSLKALPLVGENNLRNRPVFAGFYQFKLIFQTTGDRPVRTGLKFAPAGPDQFNNIRPVTTLLSLPI
jgi:hypothetical protein